MTTTLEPCTACRKLRRAETLRVEVRRYASGRANTVKICPTCLAQRKPPRPAR